MFKKFFIVVSILISFCFLTSVGPYTSQSIAADQDTVASKWFVKGGVGFDATKKQLEKAEGNFAGDAQVLRLIKGNNIAIQGGYSLLQSPTPDIDYYHGTLVIFTRDIRDQSKFNPYLLVGGGFAHTDSTVLAYDVGIGILFPLFGSTPNLEIKVIRSGDISKAIITIGWQMGLGIKL